MAEIINASIDISKFKDSEIIEGKNGAKYINFSLIINDTANDWGKNVSISKVQTKEEREQKARKTFVGQGVSVWRNGEVLKFEKKEDNTGNDNELKRRYDDNLPF